GPGRRDRRRGRRADRAARGDDLDRLELDERRAPLAAGLVAEREARDVGVLLEDGVHDAAQRAVALAVDDADEPVAVLARRAHELGGDVGGLGGLERVEIELIGRDRLGLGLVEVFPAHPGQCAPSGTNGIILRRSAAGTRASRMAETSSGRY